MPGINDVVRVTSTIRGGGVATDAFGGGLIITTDDTLPAGGVNKIARFGSLDGVLDVFADGSDPAEAASAWFRIEPAPGPLRIGRWATAEVPTALIGGQVTAAADSGNLDASNASFSIDDIDVSVDISSADTYTAIAAIIQTAIQALASSPANDPRFSSASFVFISGGFKLALDGSPTATIPAGFAAHTAGTGTDISSDLGMDVGTAVYKQGSEAETIREAIDAMEQANTGFYFLMLDMGVPATVSTVDTVEALAAAAQTGRYQYAMLGTGDQALVTNETTSQLANVSADESGRTFGNWDHEQSFLAVGAAARMSAQNLTNGGQVINPNLRSLAGISPSEITDVQALELARKRVNYYVNRLGKPGYTAGWTFDPDEWIDARMLVDWLSHELELAVFELLSDTDVIPQTIPGIAALRETITNVMEKGITSGGIAPGKVTSATQAEIRQATGNQLFDGFLSNGYLINIGSLITQSQADRVRRVAPPVRIWAKGSGAINFVPIRLDFEQ